MLFESVANGLDVGAAREPGTIQWEFRDLEPWHVVIANGSTHVARGAVDDPTVRFQVGFEDWVDVFAGRKDPRRLMLRGRFRPRGDLRWLFKSRKMFPAG